MLDWWFNRRIAARLLKRRHVLCIGDSHIRVLEHVDAPRTWFRVKPLDGATATGILNPKSRSGSFTIFTSYLRRAKPWQQVIVQLGEVDCGYVIWDRAARHGISLEEQLDSTLQSYATFIASVAAMGFQRVTILSVPLPTIGDDPRLRGQVARVRQGVSATQAQRTQLTLAFNERLRERCDELGVEFVDVSTDLYDAATGLIARRYVRPTHHDHHLADAPYAKLVTEQLARSRPTSASLPAVTIVAHDAGSVGGMERQLGELIEGLRGRGHEVSVIARSCKIAHLEGVRFHRVRGPSRPFLLAYPWFLIAGTLAVWGHRRGVVQATGAIVLNRVDVIAVHCCHQAYEAKPGRPTRLFRVYGRAVGVLKRVVERWCVRLNPNATFVCVSDGVAAEMREYFPRTAGRVVTIHNGVDTRAFAPGSRRTDALALRARLGLPEDRLVAAFVGGDWEHKGLAHAIGALEQAPEWDLVVAGRGQPELYRDLARSSGVEARVHWLGVLGDIEPVFELADAFVLASSYETFSLVTFEAAATGLPIIATPVNGVRELIEDGVNGYLIAPSTDAIAERLRGLASDPGLRERLGVAARSSALAFPWERMIAEHSALYVRLADARA